MSNVKVGAWLQETWCDNGVILKHEGIFITSGIEIMSGWASHFGFRVTERCRRNASSICTQRKGI